jgi:hypothetical protein
VEPPLMSFRLTAGVLVALLLLGGLVWFTEFRDKGDTTPTADQSRPTIVKFEDRDVHQVEVVKGDQQVLMQRAEDGEWSLQPSGQAADRLRIAGLLFRLSTVQATRLVADDPPDLTLYGLSAPGLTVTVTLNDGTAHGLAVGSKAPTDTGTYVKRTDGPAVYLIANQLVTDLERMVNEPPIVQPTPSPSPSPSPSPAG